MELNLGKLSAVKLKELSKVVDAERKRRGKRSPARHDAPMWSIPREAVTGAVLKVVTREKLVPVAPDLGCHESVTP